MVWVTASLLKTAFPSWTHKETRCNQRALWHASGRPRWLCRCCTRLKTSSTSPLENQTKDKLNVVWPEGFCVALNTFCRLPRSRSLWFHLAGLKRWGTLVEPLRGYKGRIIPAASHTKTLSRPLPYHGQRLQPSSPSLTKGHH